MEVTTPKFDLLKEIGSGAFGKFSIISGHVFLVYDKVLKGNYALKRTEKAGQEMSREIEILEKINDCEQVVKLIVPFVFYQECVLHKNGQRKSYSKPTI